MIFLAREEEHLQVLINKDALNMGFVFYRLDRGMFSSTLTFSSAVNSPCNLIMVKKNVKQLQTLASIMIKMTPRANIIELFLWTRPCAKVFGVPSPILPHKSCRTELNVVVFAFYR